MSSRNDSYDPCAPKNPSNSPREIEFGESTKSKESELHNLQLQLCHIQREQTKLMQQRKLLSCTSNPCSTCPGSEHNVSTKCSSLIHNSHNQEAFMSTSSLSSKTVQSDGACSQQFRDLREQYCRLQEDYKNKVREVSCLRSDLDKLRCTLKEIEYEKKRQDCSVTILEKKIKTLEEDLGNKEQILEQEQALIVARHRYNEIQDELEEVRTNLQDQENQTETYRKKYIQAQQMFEEQKRQLELMEKDNARINDNVSLEINRIKNQFQEKLSELAPLPEILKCTQMKLQEAQKIQLSLERICNESSREIVSLDEKCRALQSEKEKLEDENDKTALAKLKDQFIMMKAENEELKEKMLESDEVKEKMKKKVDEKLHEIAQLTAMLEQVREDAARQIVRTKERNEVARKTLQNQISELEKEVAQSHALTRAAQKDKDEIGQKIQKQIDILNETFAQAQGRLNLLQGHVNYLKDSNSGSILTQNHVDKLKSSEDHSNRGFDSCCCKS